MLTNLKIARELLASFLDPATDFNNILASLKEKLPDGKLEILTHIDTSSENLSEITLRFSQINQGSKGIIPRIISFMNHGWFYLFIFFGLRKLLLFSSFLTYYTVGSEAQRL